MKCCRCDKPALVRVHDQGFCRAHKDEAKRIQTAAVHARDALNTDYERASMAFQRGERIKDERFRTKRQHS